MISGKEKSEPHGSTNGGETRHLSRAIALGTNLAAGMAVFCLLGYWIDKRYGGGGAGPWTLAGMFLGLLYGGYEVWKVVRLIDRDANSGHVNSGREGKQQ